VERVRVIVGLDPVFFAYAATSWPSFSFDRIESGPDVALGFRSPSMPTPLSAGVCARETTFVLQRCGSDIGGVAAVRPESLKPFEDLAAAPEE
jgi:hypothetical protein